MKRIVSLFAVVILTGCANPSISTYKQSYFEQHTPQKILITRFEGNPDFVEESTDYFASLLESRIDAEVIQSSPIRTESTDVLSSGSIAPLELAINEAKRVNADLLIVGKVTSHKTAGSLNGFSTIRVYDVQSGQKVASFHRPSGMLMAWSEHQCVMAAVKRTVSDVQGIIK